MLAAGKKGGGEIVRLQVQKTRQWGRVSYFISLILQKILFRFHHCD